MPKNSLFVLIKGIFIIVFTRNIKILAKASSSFTFLLNFLIFFWEKKILRSWKIPIVSCTKSIKTWIKEHNSDGVLVTVPKITSLAALCIQIFRAGVLTHSLRSWGETLASLQPLNTGLTQLHRCFGTNHCCQRSLHAHAKYGSNMIFQRD